MENPVSFGNAYHTAKQLGLTYRQRLNYNELDTLCKIMHNKPSYIEVGVYDGLSAFIIGMCTKASNMTLIDINITEKAYKCSNFLTSVGIDVQTICCDALKAEIGYHSWCMLDADHSYKSTKECYEYYKNLAGVVVLHDIEMPGPKQLLEEIGGIKILSTETNLLSPDGKRLPELGYGIAFS